MHILMVLTSHDQLGGTGKKTGFWLEEFAAPYYVFKDAGVQITLASPLGGQPPLDPKSDEPGSQTRATVRFKSNRDAELALANTVRLSNVKAGDCDAVFYPGGHGPLWDLAEDPDSIRLIEVMFGTGKPVAAVCHAPGVLRHARAPDRSALVKGKSVTGFSDTEEEAVGLTTCDLAKLAQGGGDFFGIDTSNQGRVMIFAGGIPLYREGRVVGAIGVSGGSGAQDQAVAEAGAAYFAARELLAAE